jgi:hypothetical protein
MRVETYAEVGGSRGAEVEVGGVEGVVHGQFLSLCARSSALPIKLRHLRSDISQIPPDLVVQFQPIDIVDSTLEKILCMRLVSQREIKG